MKTTIRLVGFIKCLSTELQEGVLAACKQVGRDPNELEVKRVGTATGLDAFKLSEGERAIVQYISTRDVDRDGEVIMPRGMILSEFMKAPQVFWAHNYGEPPIGSDDAIEADDYGVKAKTRYATTQRANDLWTLRKEGHLRTASIGFVPLESVSVRDSGFNRLADNCMRDWAEFKQTRERCIRITSKALLLEHSDVGVPCNPNALTIAVAKGLNISTDTIRQFGLDEVSNLTRFDEAFSNAVPCGPFGESAWGLKPYPSEHSARIADPDRFDEFRRENDKFGSGIHAIWGIIKGPPRKAELQAIRFDAKKFTVAAAKAWLKEHDYDPLAFEPAKGEEQGKICLISAPAASVLAHSMPNVQLCVMETVKGIVKQAIELHTGKV